MKTSQFAVLRLIVPDPSYTSKDGEKPGVKRIKVGMAQNLRIENAFGTRMENVLGNPMPIIQPGYPQFTITMEKASIDGKHISTIGAMSPIWAHVGNAYKNLIDTKNLPPEMAGMVGNGDQMLPFFFIIDAYDRIAKGKDLSGKPYTANLLGTYACVISNYSTGLSSQNALVLENITAYAKLLDGAFFNQHLKDAFAGDTNGMADLIYQIMYGYN